MEFLKKTIKFFFVFCLVVVIGGASGVFADRVVIPWFCSLKYLERFSFLQRINEKVTVINKIEQITVHEDFSVAKTSQNILPAVVSIVEYVDNDLADGRKGIQTSSDIREHVKTGIVLTGDGLILSGAKKEFSSKDTKVNIDGNLKHKVFLSDGREFNAKRVAYDAYTDIEFFKIDVENLPAVQFGNSDELEIGEKIIIIGNATGEYQNTFSVGLISEKNKSFSLLNSELSSSEEMEGVIISDSKIDQSNIGGPVVDFNGTVVGIAHYIEKDGQEVGFIIPINKLRGSIDNVLKNNNQIRASLGVYYLSINKEIALLSNLPVNEGALVYSFSGKQGLAVKKGSAADLAGIKLEDIIVSVDKEKVSLDNPLSQIISERNKGEAVNIRILRDKEYKSIEVVLK